jgi:hypothetical protein
MPNPTRHHPHTIALITMTIIEQRPWNGMCSIPAFVECPRTGFFGKMLDAIFGVRTKPNPSKFAGKIVAVPSGFQPGDIWLHPSGEYLVASQWGDKRDP